MSVVQVGNSLRVTLPVEIVKAMGLKRGDKVGMTLENSHLRLRKLAKVNPSSRPAAAKPGP